MGLAGPLVALLAALALACAGVGARPATPAAEAAGRPVEAPASTPAQTALKASAEAPAEAPSEGSGATPSEPPRQLFIALDSVPYELVRDLADPARGEEALFQGFRGPVPLISTFPSTTSVALGGMLAPFGLERSPGYEARFFDWQKRRVRGGGPVSYARIHFPWREFFDWNRKGPVGSAFEALRPIKAGIKRLERALDEFAVSDQERYYIYIAATDVGAHMRGPQALGALLAALDRRLQELHGRPGPPFVTVVFSDHGIAGGEPLVNVWRGLKRAVTGAGFRVTRRLRRPQDIVLTPFGLVSSFEVYVHEEVEPRVAEVLAGVPGVDLCVLADAGGWRVVSSRGTAAVRYRPGAEGGKWSYEPLTGDPLGLAPGAAPSSTGPSGPDGAGWRSDADWLAATLETEYPDALHRLARAFDLVLNPASLLCSLAPGYMYGAPGTEYLARIGGGRLRWTHGALSRDESLGFLLSDAPGWDPPPAARFDRALVPFAGDARRGG